MDALWLYKFWCTIMFFMHFHAFNVFMIGADWKCFLWMIAYILIGIKITVCNSLNVLYGFYWDFYIHNNLMWKFMSILYILAKLRCNVEHKLRILHLMDSSWAFFWYGWMFYIRKNFMVVWLWKCIKFFEVDWYLFWLKANIGILFSYSL